MNIKWKANPVVVADGNISNELLNHLDVPRGIRINARYIYIADWDNDRIVQ